MGDLTGKVAVITGAGRGLGREEAIQFAKQGARVVINDIDRPEAVEAAQSAVEEIKGFGGEAMVVLGDCADSGDAENLMKSTLDAYGDLNIMVNNAGFCRDKTIFGMSDDEFDSVVRVHLRGHFVNMRNATAYWRDKAKTGVEVYGRLVDGGQVDLLDMSLWDFQRATPEGPFEGRPLLDLFAEQPRGDVRLGVAGKIHDPADVQEVLDRGVDIAVLGRVAILHHDYPRLLANPGFEPRRPPVTPEVLAGEGVSPAFVEYLSSNFRGFVAGT